MTRKRSNTSSDTNLHAGPATAALESAIQIMEEFEASEQMKRDPYKGKRSSDRFDTSIESALLGFPRICWQTSDHRSQQQQQQHVMKKQMLEHVREHLNLHHSPHNRHSNYPYGHHSGLVRCLYFASDLSETAGIEEDPTIMDVVVQDDNQDTIMIMD